MSTALIESRATILALVAIAKRARLDVDRATHDLGSALRRLEERVHRRHPDIPWEWRERRAQAEARATLARLRAAERAQRAALAMRRACDACELAIARYTEASRLSLATSADERRRVQSRLVVDLSRLADGAIVLSLACGHALTIEPLVGPMQESISCPMCSLKSV